MQGWAASAIGTQSCRLGMAGDGWGGLQGLFASQPLKPSFKARAGRAGAIRRAAISLDPRCGQTSGLYGLPLYMNISEQR